MQQLLYVLPALMCPLGMGAMMWFMMKGSKNQRNGQGTPGSQLRELSALRAEIEGLRTAQGSGAAAQHGVPVSLRKSAGVAG